jgi:hypothetical protein
MKKVFCLSVSSLVCRVALCVTLTGLSGAMALRASESLDESGAANADALSSLGFLKKSLQEYPSHRAELIAAALETFAADEQNKERVIFVARETFPDETTVLVEELMLLDPDAVGSLRTAFLADTATMRVALAEVGEKEPAPSSKSPAPVMVEAEEAADPAELTIDLAQVEPIAGTFALAVDESLIDPASAVDASFDFHSTHKVPSISSPAPLSSVSEEEASKDHMKMAETSASADESSLNNSLEFDESDERFLAKATVRIDDAWKPSEDIYLDESKFEKRRLAAASQAAPEAPEERVALEFQSTVDHQADELARPPLNLPQIHPEL